MKTPSPNGGNGRDPMGRFTKGNPGGPGNPFARRVALMRQTMLEAVSDEDLREIVAALVNRAKRGEKDSVQILFDRLFGKPAAAPDPDRVELEELLLAKLVRQSRPTRTELLLAEIDM
jgi:hypothetical protein